MLKEYIKYNKRILAILIGLTIAGTMVIIGFQVDYRIYLYLVAIDAVLLLVFALIDYPKFRRKHKSLLALNQNIGCNADNMPYCEDLIDEDYQRIITRQSRERRKVENEYGRKYDEMIHYYNVWAHQIKTPISAIKLLLQSQENNRTHEQAGENDKEILSEVSKIEQYVEMVLCYLRLDGDTSDFMFKEYELDVIIKRSVRKFSNQFIRSKNKLIYEENEKSVITDEKWLQFVIEQLLSNALKYTKKGTVKIYYTDETLIIEDDGIGIAAEDLPRIFERGFTGYNGRLDKKSTGIGLYLCKRIMDSLGHSIEVESQAGRGTKVKLDFCRRDLGKLE